MSERNPSFWAHEIMAAIMWGPKTFAELSEFTGASLYTVRSMVAMGRLTGVYYVTKGVGNAYKVHLQRKPYERDDEGLALRSPNSYNKLQGRTNGLLRKSATDVQPDARSE